MTTREKLKREFMLSSKRYGLKSTKYERVSDWLAIALLLFSAVEFFRYMDDFQNQMLFVLLMVFSGFLTITNTMSQYQRRIRELGGDILDKKDKPN